jgi:hypothetical protein
MSRKSAKHKDKRNKYAVLRTADSGKHDDDDDDPSCLLTLSAASVTPLASTSASSPASRSASSTALAAPPPTRARSEACLFAGIAVPSTVLQLLWFFMWYVQRRTSRHGAGGGSAWGMGHGAESQTTAREGTAGGPNSTQCCVIRFAHGVRRGGTRGLYIVVVVVRGERLCL